MKKLRYISFLIITMSSLCSFLYAQEQVYVLAAMEGQGYLRSKDGKCFVITPFHVVEGSAGALEVIGPYGFKGIARVTREYKLADLAVLELDNNKIQCSKWLEMQNFDLMLSTQSGGHLSFREKDGSIIPLEVKFVNITEDFISIKSQENDRMLNEGMSGGTLLVNGAPSGMLLSVDTNTGIGNIIRKDAIMRFTAPFFEPPKVKPDLSMEAKNSLANQIFRFPFIHNQFMIDPKMLKLQTGEKISEIKFGYASDQLIKRIDVKKLVAGSLTTPYFLPVKPGIDSLWYQVEFLDGTLSDIISFSLHNNKDFKGVEIPSLQKEAPSLYLMASTQGFPSLRVQWEVPYEATASLYSFDNGGYFRLEKGQGYSVFNQLPIEPSTDYIRLAFESDGVQIGPYEYPIKKTENLILSSIKEQLNKTWEQQIDCYSIPDQASKSEKEVNIRMVSFGFKNFDISPGILCKIKFWDRFLLTSLKEIRIGTNPKQLTSKFPVNLDLQTFHNENTSRFQEPFLNHKFPGNGNEIYMQIQYFDNSFTEVKRIPVKSLF